jgi:hypothetical protein
LQDQLIDVAMLTQPTGTVGMRARCWGHSVSPAARAFRRRSFDQYGFAISGLMFWFKQKKFSGSYFFLTAMSRS